MKIRTSQDKSAQTQNILNLPSCLTLTLYEPFLPSNLDILDAPYEFANNFYDELFQDFGNDCNSPKVVNRGRASCNQEHVSIENSYGTKLAAQKYFTSRAAEENLYAYLITHLSYQDTTSAVDKRSWNLVGAAGTGNHHYGPAIILSMVSIAKRKNLPLANR